MPDVLVSRRRRIAERCVALGADAALVCHPANLRYLLGPAAGHGTLLLLGERAWYAPAPAESAPNGEVTERPAGPPGPPPDAETVPVEDGADPALVLAERLDALGVRRLAVEEHHLSVTRYRAIDAACQAGLVDLGRAVEQLRVVKDEREIDALRAAAEIADQALGELVESILVGRTERHLAMELERRVVDRGGDDGAAPISVATGPHSGLRGHRSGDRRVEDGDFLTVSLGAGYRGYRCSVTRTFLVGTEPADWQVELYDLVFAAQRAGREALAPGVACREVHRAARDVLAAAGHEEHAPRLRQWLGHGVGLELVEEPSLAPSAPGKLDARVPVTVEPGVHLPGLGGVRIEDTLVVRAERDGGPELLTITTKELLVL